MSGVNKVILIGNLGRDPEVKTMSDGSSLVNLSVATSETWRDKQSGERREKTEWHNVVIFNERIVKVAQTYLRKGSKVFLEGQLQTRKWQDKAGVDHYSTEIVLQRFRGELVLLDSPKDKPQISPQAIPQAVPQSQTRSQTRSLANPQSVAIVHSELDDEIPF